MHRHHRTALFLLKLQLLQNNLLLLQHNQLLNRRHHLDHLNILQTWSKSRKLTLINLILINLIHHLLTLNRHFHRLRHFGNPLSLSGLLLSDPSLFFKSFQDGFTSWKFNLEHPCGLSDGHFLAHHLGNEAFPGLVVDVVVFLTLFRLFLWFLKVLLEIPHRYFLVLGKVVFQCQGLFELQLSLCLIFLQWRTLRAKVMLNNLLEFLRHFESNLIINQL